MRIAYLDCFSGISGDMFLGALVDAGVPAALLEETVRALRIDARLEVSRVTRAGISATKVDVIVRGEKDVPREQWQARRLEEEFAHQHGHEHGAHGHHNADGEDGAGTAAEDGSATTAEGRSHGHEPHSHSHEHARALTEIRELIERSAVSETAKRTATRIFENLGAAEAKIHNCSIDEVHFHEVGAEDAIVDIVGAAVGSEALEVDEWVCSPLNVGSGTVKCAHGVLPVPAPATLELLKGAPIYSSQIQKELVTPTGAAIVKTLVSRFAELPRLSTENIGYGAGFRDFHEQPNVLRLTIGTDVHSSSEKKLFETDTVTVLEANLDDMNPQIVAHVFDRLFEAGALDAFCTPVQMKKGRPGLVLTVLSYGDAAEKLARIIFAETTTIGLRTYETNRLVLPRRHVEVETPWGVVRMKVANLNGTVANYAPEYEDCRRLAAANDVPLKAVMQEAIRVYLQTLDRKPTDQKRNG